MIGLPRVTFLRNAHVRGYTLIELLIVLLIIVILASLLISLIGPLREMVKISTTTTRIAAIHQGLVQVGMNEGSAVFKLQSRSEYQPAAIPADSEPGLGGIITFGPPDPAATGAAVGLPTIGKRPPPLSAQNYGDWGYRGRAHLAYPWGKKFPDPNASGGTALMGPERFRLRDLSPFNTRKLLAIANLLPTKQSDPTWGQTQYMTNRTAGESWNDAWGHPLVVAAALYQPTWRTTSSASTVPGYLDGAWPTPPSATAALSPSTPPIVFSSYGPTMETPSSATDRSARKALLDHLKLYQYNHSVYIAVAAVGPHAWVPDTKLTSNTAIDWADGPTTPVSGTLNDLWAQANWICQQAKVSAFDQDWSELSFGSPPWKDTQDSYLTTSKNLIDANRSHYIYDQKYARSLLSAPVELK
jgi:prepilin-type N-terminal cleavage/methylation domain-containing protein